MMSGCCHCSCCFFRDGDSCAFGLVRFAEWLLLDWDTIGGNPGDSACDCSTNKSVN